MKAEPPAFPYRDDVLVENGAAASKSCLSPLEMHSPTAAVGLLPAGEASTTTRITFYQPRFWFCPTEETNYERTSTQYALYHSSFRRSQLPAPPGEALYKQNQGKILCSILAVLQVVSALARFGECGAHCFVRSFFVWAPDSTRGCSVFRLMDYLGVILQERYRRILYAVRIAVDRSFLLSG